MNTVSGFKAGDRVVRISCNHGQHVVGQEYVITYVITRVSHYGYLSDFLIFNDSPSHGYDSRNYKLVKSKAAKRKVV